MKDRRYRTIKLETLVDEVRMIRDALDLLATQKREAHLPHVADGIEKLRDRVSAPLFGNHFLRVEIEEPRTDIRYETNVRAWDDRLVVVFADYEAGEAQTRNYPGSPSGVYVVDVRDAETYESLIEKLEDEDLLEDIERETLEAYETELVEAEYDARLSAYELRESDPEW